MWELLAMPQHELPYEEIMDDGRRKLHPDQYEDVRKFYKFIRSQRKTAEHFGISRRLVTFILYPERLQELQRRNRENQHWLKHYDAEKRREYMRKYRLKKRAAGLITGTPKHTDLSKYTQPE